MRGAGGTELIWLRGAGRQRSPLAGIKGVATLRSGLTDVSTARSAVLPWPPVPARHSDPHEHLLPEGEHGLQNSETDR